MNFVLSLIRPSIRQWMMLLPLFLLLWYSPYVDFPIRVFTWVVASFIFIGSIFYSWRLPVFRWILIGLYLLSALFLLWPSQPPENKSNLRASYCDALSSYEGCRYVWGGVGYFGIDCSGFVQKGLEDALVTRGLLTLNPSLIRESIWLYWHRTTAKVLGEGHHGKIYMVTTCPTLYALDYSKVQPGDLAVTASGEHIMAYLGNKTWIAADPSEGKVTRFVMPESKNIYLFTPMKIVRWSILNG